MGILERTLTGSRQPSWICEISPAEGGRAFPPPRRSRRPPPAVSHEKLVQIGSAISTACMRGAPAGRAAATADAAAAAATASLVTDLDGGAVEGRSLVRAASSAN